MASIHPADLSRQRASLRSVFLPSILAGLLLVLTLPSVDARDDHDQARAAVQAGEVMPLPQFLETLQRSHPGQLLALELEREDGRWIYEIKLLQADGRLLKLEVDAKTAQVLKRRYKDVSNRERRDQTQGEARQ